ncbi:bifunctional DNA primase/polymerase [Cuneatibacter sp. NSJ-177]|uniref:bifunctional DNA primase/polymerase n=1 Tax=Cuneatibacter sp. NSJ-177 TaxID=2931401 RepID=UPI001FD1E29A|nr:bifunctional DNA primase/polymerase [Cuneatibacter sp. NSJ-177]MCJ7833851.1 bifunctional DNA primase/polymerase [Cuneatibacter sp. NSJ-177]
MPSTIKLKEQALYYASLGLAVFPLKPKSKFPATENGFHSATTDREEISRWWDKHPDYNIGIATGSISGGVFVIDLDIDEDKGLNGYEVLKEWQREHGDLPETWMAITGRGGYHLFYKDNSTVRSKVGIYEGVDIRGDGGYVVAPPSVHPNGRSYEWEIAPEDMPLTSANGKVLDFILPMPEKEQTFTTPETIAEGERNKTLFTQACSMRARGDAEEAILAAVRATNNSRCVPPLDDKEVEIIVKSSFKYKGGTAPYKAVLDDGKFRPVKEIPKLNPVTAAELDKMEIPPVVYLVEPILPEGLNMLGAPSKYYKSYMAIDLCLCICQGMDFLGFKTKKSACLYLDLESTKRRPRDRIRQILGNNPMPENFHLLTAEDDVKPIGNGFAEQIEGVLTDHPDIHLIVIDVFQRVRAAAKKNQTGYDRDYDDLGVIKKIADTHNVGVLLIHHTRKMKDPNDVFNELSGSVGIMGALDSAWVITKDERFSNEATLSITGRDMESRQLKVRFNKSTFRWEYIGTAEEIEKQRELSEYDQSPIKKTVKKLLDQSGGTWEGGASEIIEASKYFNSRIYDDASSVGKWINRFSNHFWLDGIEVNFGRKAGGNRKRVYVFTVPSVPSDHTVPSVPSVPDSSDR